MMRKMLIDTDTASDDAVALVMALKFPEVEVVAITIVAGNVDVSQASLNARYTLQMCNQSIPVYEGCHKPMMRARHSATFFHGEDGMGNMFYPAPQQQADSLHAVPAIIAAIRANPGITLVTLGPLTNIALALIEAPDIVGLVDRCVVMGGAACAVGNITPTAEYNVWCDPEAARICFASGLPIEMVGWELSRGEANLSVADMERYKTEIDTPLSNFVIDCNASGLRANTEWLGDPGLGLPDPVAMAVALDPSICSRKSDHFVEIECEGVFTRGMTVVDALNVAQDDVPNVAMWAAHRQRPVNVSVCWEIDNVRWKALLEASVLP
ncbi:MAG: purine nucleosidase [Candidatus Azotimanducaceae bacterium]|jgi:purine nucleosidase